MGNYTKEASAAMKQYYGHYCKMVKVITEYPGEFITIVKKPFHSFTLEDYNELKDMCKNLNIKLK